MDPEKLQKISISPEQIRQVYDQGPDAVINLVLPLVESINWLIDVVNDQDKRIKVLENQLNTNSRNSSKPPSSDSAYSKQKNRKKRKGKSKSNNRKGTTLRQILNPDELETCEVTSCQHCRYDLSDVPVRGLDKRQVFEIPPIFVHVTEYQGEIKKCPHCGEISKAAFPDGVTHKAQYGPRVQSLAVYLRDFQLLPTQRTIGLFKDIFGLTISEGTLVNITHRGSKLLVDFMERIKSKLQKSRLVHFDETGINVAGKLKWLHTAGNKLYTYLYPHQKRGHDAFDEIGILPIFKGVAVHDFWRSYQRYDCNHSYCNAHLIRELIFAEENLGQQWAKSMLDLLLDIKTEVDKSPNDSIEEKPLLAFEKQYEQIIQQGYAANPPPEKTGKRGRPAKGKALCLVERMDLFREDILRFANESGVPFENNLAERDLRMSKVRQKISGTFRNLESLMDYCRIRSYIATAQKQKINVFTALSDLFLPDAQLNIL